MVRRVQQIPQAVIFDLDETLLDRRGSLDMYALTLFSAFESSARCDADDFREAFHRLDGNGRVARAQFFSRLSETAFVNVDADALAEHFYTFAWRNPILFSGVVDTISAFKANACKVGLVTNGGSNSQNSKLTNSRLSEQLDAYLISEEFGVKKPDPSIYTEIVRRLDVEPEHSWFAGDDPISDVCGPAQVGLNTAWVERYTPWPAERKRCYQLRIGSVSELASALLVQKADAYYPDK